MEARVQKSRRLAVKICIDYGNDSLREGNPIVRLLGCVLGWGNG